MPASGSHRQNHYVPKFMIRYWETRKDGVLGVFVHTLADARSNFSPTTKRRPYPFAIAEDLYVPRVDGQRTIAMEAGWLNGQETALSKLIALAHQRSALLARNVSEYTKISMALFALEHRSRFVLESIREAVEGRLECRALISANPEREPHRLALENLINIVTEMHGRHWPLTLHFLHSGDSEFILTDRPGFLVDEKRVMVLTNKVAVCYEKSSGEPTFEHLDAESEFVATINRMLAMRARDWIVVHTPSLLEHWVQVNQSLEADEYRRTERIEPIAPHFLTSGYSFRSDQ